MSVFTLDTQTGNPVTIQDVDETCAILGVALPAHEKEAYRTLLAVYHEAAEDLMAIPEVDLRPDLSSHTRQNLGAPELEDNPLNAWSYRCKIEDAQAGPDALLKGKTVALKDCIAVAGMPMSLGSSIFDDYVPNIDATIVSRIIGAGGVITGRAVCENMCHSATSHSASSGVVHNPYAHGYSSGGSSSGSGALVAGGAVDMAIGADQGGSIRIPAGWCGLYGLKPTFGLVPYTGIASNEPTNDHAGPMTRTLLENALLLQAIAGTDGIDDRSFGAPTPARLPRYHASLVALERPRDLHGIKIGVISESLDMPAMDPRVLATFLDAVEGFKRLGATVEHVSIPMHKRGAAIWTGISKIGGAANKLGLTFGRRGYVMNDCNGHLAPMTPQAWDQLYPSSKNILLNGIYGQRKFPTLLGHATNASTRLRQDYDRVLSSGFAVLLAPNLPYIANSHASVPFAQVQRDGGNKTHNPLDLISKQLGLTSNTAPFNQSGHPVLAMPCGMLDIQEGPLAGSGTKLPVSLQVVGPWYGEEQVYRVAYAWELANDWTKL